MRTATRPRTSAQLNAERYASKPLVEGRLVTFSFYMPDIYWRHVAMAATVVGVVALGVISSLGGRTEVSQPASEREMAAARLAVGPDVSQATGTIQHSLSQLDGQLKKLESDIAAMSAAQTSEAIDTAALRQAYEEIAVQVTELNSVFARVETLNREARVRFNLSAEQTILSTAEQDALANAAFQRDIFQEKVQAVKGELATLDARQKELLAAETKAKEEAARAAQLAAAEAERARQYNTTYRSSEADTPSLPRRQRNFSRSSRTPNWRTDRW